MYKGLVNIKTGVIWYIVNLEKTKDCTGEGLKGTYTAIGNAKKILQKWLKMGGITKIVVISELIKILFLILEDQSYVHFI